MKTKKGRLGKAIAALEAGHDAEGLHLLHDLLEATEDPELVDEVRRLAVDRHDASTGFDAIEWKRLAIDAESRELTAPR